MTKPQQDKTRSDRITTAEMKDALIRSGYLLESRVESRLREHWGYVEANGTYSDPETEKSREFDLFGMSAHSCGPEEDDRLFGVLLVECINNPQPLAILTKKPLVPFLHREDVKVSGLPVKIPNKEIRVGWKKLADFLDLDNFHHYCKGRIGTQFCSFSRKRKEDEWMARHEDSHFDSFRKLCDVTEHYIDRHYKDWLFDGTKESVNLQMYYPIIVVQGDLVEVQQSKKGVELRPCDYLQFRQSVTRIGREEVTYQIDIMRERYLPKYLKLIDSELGKTAALLNDNKDTVRLAINTIVEQLKGVASREDHRDVMDYSRLPKG